MWSYTDLEVLGRVFGSKDDVSKVNTTSCGRAARGVGTAPLLHISRGFDKVKSMRGEMIAVVNCHTP